jgi:hypothetical protein
MSAGILRNRLDINARGIMNRIGEFSFKIWKSSEFEPLPTLAHTPTASSVAASMRKVAVYENHPLIPVYGRFRDDPSWDRYMRNIEEYSQEIDAIERTQE